MRKLGGRLFLHPITVFSFVTLILFLFFSTNSLASEWKWPKSLSITTKTIASTSYATTAAWTPVMDQMTGMKVRVIPQDSSVSQAKGLKSNQYDLWMESAVEFSSIVMEGKKNMALRDAGPFPLRVVWLGQMAYFVFFVRGDSPIKTVHDLKPGVRIANWTVVPGFKMTLNSLLAWADVKPEDAKWIPFGAIGATLKSIPDGKADVTYATSTSPGVVAAASKPHGLHFLELDPVKDPAGAKRYLSTSPTHSFGKVTIGVKSAIGTTTRATPYFLAANANMDVELAYNIAKWLHKNYDSYKDKHRNCKLMAIDLFRSMLDTSYLPLHDGTIKYLKEIGMWSAADEKRQKYNLGLVAKYIKAYKAAIAEADEKKISINPKSTEWVAMWENHKKDIPRFKVMLDIP